MKYSIIIPVYNEEENIEVFYNRLIKVLKNLHKSYEVIFVNDGSTDNSLNILKKIRDIRIISLTRNFGQQAALMAAFNNVKGDEIITIDVDLQMNPEDIPKLINKINEGYDIVYGVYNKNRKNIFRKICSNFAKWSLSKLIPS